MAKTFKGWDRKKLTIDGTSVEAICPIVVSASRATDIPAYYAKWFCNRLKDGYAKWVNPFNAHQVQHISFAKTRVIVFWSKNPRPLMKYLPEIDALGINYYFQFTLNDYEKEGLEPKVPPLNERVETFKALSAKLGKKKIVWRYDPLILTDTLTVDDLVRKVRSVADRLAGHTEKLVFSFADISSYRKVQANLTREEIRYTEFTKDTMQQIAERLAPLRDTHNLKLATCAEGIDLETYGIQHNRCIDDQLMIDLFSDDPALMGFLGYEPTFLDEGPLTHLKDKGQRKECGCIVSKDIGTYDTCPHLCTYCYANASLNAVKRNHGKHDANEVNLIP